jgi:hypothetical protein
MAITIYQKPQALSPAYNNQTFTALSNQIAVADFKYVVTVTINGVANVKEYLQRPDGWLVVDVKEWVQNFIEHYFNPLLSLANPIEIATKKAVEAVVLFQEYYSGILRTGVSYSYTAFDACLTEAAFRNYNYQNYIFNQTAGKLFLSKTSTTITPDNRLLLNQDMYLHFIDYQNVTNIVIDLMRPDPDTDIPVTIATDTIPSLPTTTATYPMYVMRINSKIFARIPARLRDVIRVTFKNGVNFIASYSITLTELCTKYTDNILYYLDRDGNILFFHFDKISKYNYTKKTNKVTLNADKLNTTTGAYGANSWDREDHIVNTAIESTILLNTDWITETQSRQLNDLWSSPQVWLHNGTELLPVTITNNGYEEIKSENESLFQYNVVVNTGVVETRQRGI